MCVCEWNEIFLLLTDELHQVAGTFADKVLDFATLFANESQCVCFCNVLQDFFGTTSYDSIKVLCVLREKGWVDEHFDCLTTQNIFYHITSPLS